MVNGHVYPEVDKQNLGTTWAQRPLLFHNIRGTLHLLPAVEGSGLAEVSTSRGMAYGDLFNDGRIDVVVNNLDATPSLFRNVTGTPAAIASEPPGTPNPVPNHWIAFKLTGGPKSPRDAIGATIYLTANGFRQRADVLAGSSFASSHDQRPHFGLGGATKIDAIEIHWPDGTRQNLDPPRAVDRFYSVTEGLPAQMMK